MSRGRLQADTKSTDSGAAVRVNRSESTARDRALGVGAAERDFGHDPILSELLSNL